MKIKKLRCFQEFLDSSRTYLNCQILSQIVKFLHGLFSTDCAFFIKSGPSCDRQFSSEATSSPETIDSILNERHAPGFFPEHVHRITKKRHHTHFEQLKN